MERAKIDRWPKDVRAQLDAEIIGRNFSGYREIADLFASKGYEIKNSAVHAHGQKLDLWIKSIKRTSDTARALVADSPDEANVVGDALMRMITDRLFTLFYDLEIDQAKLSPEILAKVGKSIADLTRAQVNQKRFAEELRKEISGKVAKNVEDARARGIDQEILERAKELVRGAIDG